MSKFTKLLLFLLVLLSAQLSLATSYHFTQGFNIDGAANTAPEGWVTGETYPTKSFNHGTYTGDRCIRFNNSDSYLITPTVSTAQQLSFWVYLDTESDGAEELFVEIKTTSSNFEPLISYTVANNDFSAGEWTQFSIDLNEETENVQVRFSTVYGVEMRTLSIDDVAISYLEADEELDDTEYSHRYYIDATNGDDSQSGKSEVKAWKTFTNIHALELQANDTILLKCNSEWNDVFEPEGSGNSTGRIVLTSYGKGLKPLINAQGQLPASESYSASIFLKNDDYWKIENIAVKNYVADETEETKKYGILIKGVNKGTLKDFHINNIEISEVNGILDERENGGLGFVVTGTSTPTNFDGILIENSYFHDLANCGVFTVSSWKNRDFDSQFGEEASNGKENTWYPSYNIVVRNNLFERTDGNGMVIRIADGPLVEHNTFYMCGLRTTGNASYPYNCNNALWQFNEASHTVYNDGDADASGFDSDYFCKNTIIQYNYSHDNDWGSVLVCCNGGIERAFNDGTIVRYNIFQNDGHHMVRMSGTTTNTYIYNNVFYVGEEFDGMELLWHKNWNGYSDKTSYTNNIFYNQGQSTTYEFTESTNNSFSHNIFYGNSSSNEPSDSYKITADPQFVSPGSGDFGFNTLDGYKLLDGSPAIDAGMSMTTDNIFDFFGNDVSSSDGITIGAYQYTTAVGLSDLRYVTNVSVYPNPIERYATLDITSSYRGYISVRILTLDGKITETFSFNKNSELVSRVLSLSSLQAGAYLLQVNAGDETIIKKLVKTDL